MVRSTHQHPAQSTSHRPSLTRYITPTCIGHHRLNQMSTGRRSDDQFFGWSINVTRALSAGHVMLIWRIGDIPSSAWAEDERHCPSGRQASSHGAAFVRQRNFQQVVILMDSLKAPSSAGS